MASLLNREVVVASHNPGKVIEIQTLLVPHAVRISSAIKFDLAEPDETGTTFAANARLKAVAARDSTGLTAIADDSGLVVPALGGAPGIYSARWAGPSKNFSMAIERLKKELGAKSPSAHFICALAVAWPEGPCELFEGRVFGTLIFPPRGQNGFGYDPIFRPRGSEQTFAEMQPAQKEQISHRKNAFSKLSKRCFGMEPKAKTFKSS